MRSTLPDRPAAIRRAVRDLVAERGFHGTSMSAIAERAGVATGTAYVHYESKDELVYATYLEIKQALGEAAVRNIDPDAEPRTRYGQIWNTIYDHASDEPELARFLIQLEGSPYYAEAHRRILDVEDPLLEEASRPDFAELVIPLPPEILSSLSIGLAIRLAATGAVLDDDQREIVVESSWRAITRGS